MEKVTARSNRAARVAATVDFPLPCAPQRPTTIGLGECRWARRLPIASARMSSGDMVARAVRSSDGGDVQLRAVDQTGQPERRGIHARRVVYDKLCGQIAEPRAQTEAVTRAAARED